MSNKIKDDINKMLNNVIKEQNETEYNILKLTRITELISKLKFSFIMKTEFIDYDIIDSIWIDFIDKKFQINACKNNKIIELAGKELQNSCILENIFSTHLNSDSEDLIMIYKKNSPTLIYYLKSYKIIDINKISLPFHRMNMTTLNILDIFNESLQDGDILISFI